MEATLLEQKWIYKSANILASLSDTTKPCDDFFEFACENWIKAYPMPKGKSKLNI